MSEKIRIKDIAERAGVSVGTVDRVLHNRPNVSKPALERVKRALEEMNYTPNKYASALAYNRSYQFATILPRHEQEAYWDEIEEGFARAEHDRSDFSVKVKTFYYERMNVDSFLEACKECMKCVPDGVVVVPSSLETTRLFTDKLHEKDIPFVMLDSYMPDLNPLSFFGQDSFCSGRFAAKILMLVANHEKEIMLMKQTKNGKVLSKQQDNRESGFRHYMHDHFPEIKIVEIDLPIDLNDDAKGDESGAKGKYDDLLERFFKKHPHIHHGITFNSKAHLVGNFLLQTNRRNVQIMGYDMVSKNAECLRQGSISFLIAQHAYLQGYQSIETLFRAIALKEEVHPINYMPIELLTKENVDFYRRTQL